MSAMPLMTTEKLVQQLRTFCAQPSHPKQLADLAQMADQVAHACRSIGMRTRVVPTAGAPVVLGWKAGRSAHTVLLYHHYDVAPPGPWRTWSNEPYTLAERDDALYARGVAAGKGPLAAHLHALQCLAKDLPCNVILVAEGEALSGSPHLGEVLTAHKADLRGDFCLGSIGDRDIHGRPFCYGGAKGHVLFRLTHRGAQIPLPGGVASSIRNPAWRLTWALSEIKGEDEDIRIDGFYDTVEGPTRAENLRMRQLQIDELGRIANWQIHEFLFGMSGNALLSAEVTLPTCHLAAFSTDSTNDLAVMPSMANAILEFQLVPKQKPEEIATLLSNHLRARNFGDVEVEMLPGYYPPAHTPFDHPALQTLAACGEPVFGAALSQLPSGPFAIPLQLFSEHLQLPVASVGLAQFHSAIFGPDEHVPLEGLLRHGQLLSEFLKRIAI